MKKILVMLAIAISLGACSKDNDEPKDEPKALNQQIKINDVTKDIKGTLLDRGRDDFRFYCSADYTYDEFFEMEDDKEVFLKSHAMGLNIIFDELEIAETKRGIYKFAEGTDGERVNLVISAGKDSAYDIMADAEGVRVLRMTNLDAYEPTMTELDITNCIFAYALLDKEIEIQLDVTFSDGVTIKAHYKGTPPSSESNPFYKGNF